MDDSASVLGQPRVFPGGRSPRSDIRHGWEYERPLNDPQVAEIWCYTPKTSYVAGETIAFHVHTTRPSFEMEIYRDGPRSEVVYRADAVPGEAVETPRDANIRGCGWPVALQVVVDPSWRSGFYVVVVRVRDDDGAVFEREHFFVVRPARPATDTAIAFVVSTATMSAYNDWGGGNSYHGETSTPRDAIGNPRTSLLRPWGRGFVRLPAGAPRAGYRGDLPPFAPPHYPQHPWAHHHGYARDYGDISWALYGKLFIDWAEANGYTLDYFTMHDLDENPQALVPYRLSVVVGHDEYISAEMRQAVENQLDAGGNHARFAGNAIWQVRIEDDGTTFVAYKHAESDPLFGTDRSALVSDAWDCDAVGRPITTTFGLTGTGVIHVRFGGGAPRSAAGFTVYRPWHWSLKDTDLYFGDLIGGHPDYVVCYEVDGCDYTIRDGLPYPTGSDGAPENLEIVGLCPAIRHEEDHFNSTVSQMNTESNLPPGKYWELAQHEGVKHPRYGAAMMASFNRGAATGDGTVFNAGTADWVVGLESRNWFVEKITRKVLDTLSAPV